MACEYVIGIDEVGRGSVAGPLCVGACLMPRRKSHSFLRTLSGIKDSKQLTPQKRAEWFSVIARAARAGQCRWSTVFVSEKVIDAKGLSFALHKAIGKTLQKLHADPKVSKVLLDGGIRAPSVFLFQQTIIKGDEKEPLIAAASIMAKVARDRYMVRLAKRHPQYGFDLHKGYGTRRHYAALRKHGVCPIHRLSFLKRLRLK